MKHDYIVIAAAMHKARPENLDDYPTWIACVRSLVSYLQKHDRDFDAEQFTIACESGRLVQARRSA